ncbi:MAG: glycosyltransferase [Candidatus Margulisbacteria bacterium]|jgi:1,2-diacylglycerol 3-beta-galactosyltransferase|nr:glycosyltransferase [Candidatus Margulisiibacteriota bacterium]
MKKKILYLFSDTGGGHRSAAQAIIRAAEQLKKDAPQQEMVDVFAACSGFLNIFAKMYAPVIKFSPKLWGQLYYWLDDERKLEQLEKLSRPFILKELKKLILARRPDVIVSVHPLVNHLTVRAIRETGLRIPFIVVITDPVTLHRAWVVPEVDRCIVATPAAKKNAVRYGMPERKIRVIGMPIDPKFIQKAAAKAKAKTQAGGKFTILLMGGGEGAGGMGEIIEEFDRTGFDGQLIVVAGRNKQLETKLKARKFSFKMRVLGFTDKVPELMGESDLIITKAGPGTIAEALAMGLPIIITSWLPGQEEGNVEFVVRSNVGRVSQDPHRVVELVREIRTTAEFQEMKENIKKVSRPQAAIDIAREILRFI